MKKHITFALLFAAALTAQAQQGGISGEMLNQIKQSYKATPADKAIRNALGGTSINTLALNQENRADFDTEFSHKVAIQGNNRPTIFRSLLAFYRTERAPQPDDCQIRTG